MRFSTRFFFRVCSANWWVPMYRFLIRNIREAWFLTFFNTFLFRFFPHTQWLYLNHFTYSYLLFDRNSQVFAHGITFNVEIHQICRPLLNKNIQNKNRIFFKSNFSWMFCISTSIFVHIRILLKIQRVCEYETCEKMKNI